MIAESLSRVRARVAAACAASGRAPSEVGLVAVSKTFPAQAVAEALAAGQRDFGESRAQDLRDKAAALAAAPCSSARWHFIGRLQTNKARYVAPVAFRVHALDAIAQADALGARSAAPVPVLVAVNLGHEAAKGGVAPTGALDLCRALAAHPGVSLRGLMCIPPFREDPEAAAPFFAELADLAARGRADGLPLHELSMGMSHDFEVAIRHGATWVRVGTAIFGERPPAGAPT